MKGVQCLGRRRRRGDERKADMKECLSAKPAKTTQQEKMKSRNKGKMKASWAMSARGGMSDCLKAD